MVWLREAASTGPNDLRWDDIALRSACLDASCEAPRILFVNGGEMKRKITAEKTLLYRSNLKIEEVGPLESRPPIKGSGGATVWTANALGM